MYDTDSESAITVYDDAISVVKLEWGSEVFDKLGNRVQRALIAEEILYQAFCQIAICDPKTVQKIVRSGWLTLVDNYG